MTLTDLQHACDQWSDGLPLFEQAVRETSVLLDLPEVEVRTQLGRVARYGSPSLHDLVEQAAIDAAGSFEQTAHVAHLAAGGVPGLAIESLVLSLAAGNQRNTVLLSRKDCATAHFVEHLGVLAEQVALLPSSAAPSALRSCDVAVVYGSDETVTLVQSLMPPDSRVIAFGDRVGIAVLTEQGCKEARRAGEPWALRIADDVLRFSGHGCMSPRYVLSVGSQSFAEQTEASLHEALHRHARSRNEFRPLAIRGVLDATLLGSVTSDIALPPQASPVFEHIESNTQLHTRLAELELPLQTAILCCATSEQSELARLLADAGATRICAPGEAHFPPRNGVHEGISLISATKPLS